MTHESVLLNETIDGLDIREGDIVVDCTLGGGGHSLEICKRFGASIRQIGLDVDADAIARSVARLEAGGCSVETANASFRDLGNALDSLGIEKADKILMDLGLSSNQIEESGRGFAFKTDEPLLMTMRKDVGDGLTAYDVANSWDEENIVTILRAYGDERFARRIARGIVAARESREIKTTSDLVDIIMRSTPVAYHHGKIHPATRTFQAIRIAVNDEIGALTDGLTAAWGRLNGGGRIAVIAFHSGEDRIVKNFFRDKAKEGLAILVTKKPIVPSEEEVRRNPRSRSAKLRILIKN